MKLDKFKGPTLNNLDAFQPGVCFFKGNAKRDYKQGNKMIRLL